MDYLDYITSNHSLYDRYYDDWRLQLNSWYGSTEYKDARYLRGYQVDFNTPSESINTYVTNDDGSVVSKVKARLQQGSSPESTKRGQDIIEGSFYGEKLNNTPLYNYVKLIVAEYNSILFRNPPQRTLPDTDEVEEFAKDCNGEGDNLNEFMSLVDMYTTIFGVCHVGCYKPIGSDIPKWRIHTPLDVTNWSYKYDVDGSLKLNSIVIKIEESDDQVVYRHITTETMETIFAGSDDDYLPPVDDPRLEKVGDGTYRIVQENELGYIPVTTIYQNTKVYNNVGTTIIGDVAQIQRNMYGLAAETYAAVTYSSHPTLVVDETTDQLNDGQIGSEPGAIIRVPSSLTGEQSYTYEFVAPQLDAIKEITNLIDSNISKLTQIAMLRSEDLIKAANSGEQVEIYDDKLAGLIRRKATNMENAEYKMWQTWFDWQNLAMPEDFTISYSRQYNKRALQHEVNEIQSLMSAYERFDALFGATTFSVEQYSTPEQAVAKARELGGDGFHSHVGAAGVEVYMPFATHPEYEAALERMNPGVDFEEGDFKEDLRDRIRQRLKDLVRSTSSYNGL